MSNLDRLHDPARRLEPFEIRLAERLFPLEGMLPGIRPEMLYGLLSREDREEALLRALDQAKGEVRGNPAAEAEEWFSRVERRRRDMSQLRLPFSEFERLNNVIAATRHRSQKLPETYKTSAGAAEVARRLMESVLPGVTGEVEVEATQDRPMYFSPGNLDSEGKKKGIVQIPEAIVSDGRTIDGDRVDAILHETVHHADLGRVRGMDPGPEDEPEFEQNQRKIREASIDAEARDLDRAENAFERLVKQRNRQIENPLLRSYVESARRVLDAGGDMRDPRYMTAMIMGRDLMIARSRELRAMMGTLAALQLADVPALMTAVMADRGVFDEITGQAIPYEAEEVEAAVRRAGDDWDKGHSVLPGDADDAMYREGHRGWKRAMERMSKGLPPLPRKTAEGLARLLGLFSEVK